MDSKTKLEGKNIKCGSRTYFFDIYQAKNKNKYLLITESRFSKDDQTYKRSTFILFKEDLPKFQEELSSVNLE